MYAELAVYQAPVRRTFHYAVPADLAVAIGQLVEVSFRTSMSQGIIIDVTDSCPVPNPKPISTVLLDEPVVTPAQIILAQQMAHQTLTPISACLWLMLPPGLTKRGDMLYTLIDVTYAGNEKTEPVLSLLRERGALRGAQIDRALPKTGWREAIRPLVTEGIVRREPFLAAPDAKAHTVRMVQLAIPPEHIPQVTAKFRKGSKRLAVLELLATRAEPVETTWVMEQTGADSTAIHRLLKKGLVTVDHAERWRDPLAGKEFVTTQPPPLTPAQTTCWDIIRDHMEVLQDDPAHSPRTYLLHGVTGSGKTEIYLRAIDRVLKQGRQAIVLVPEIALVAQTVRRFAARFPDRVAVVHSSLTDGEQYDTWRRVRSGQIDIVIGPRSALFMPFADVGLIVIDEEHDDSYKQSPPIPPPYYHARDLAMMLAQITRGTVILGSATPDLTTTFRAHQGEIEYIRLPDRVMVHRERVAEQARQFALPEGRFAPTDADDAMTLPLPPVQVVDMRQELRAGNRSMFSQALRTALEETIAVGEQAILFLNRRGTASFVLCRDCGFVVHCPRCEMPMTYHQNRDQLLCHYCGTSSPQPEICPQCGSKRIRYFGAGTASVEEAVAKEFPQARTLRWDRDTTQARDAHDTILQQFVRGEANVVIGTQMIAKGLDIPRVTLVGVILAETGLGLPDYRAGERTFQLLTQVAGRAGRGWLGGRVVLQTYQPEHYAIRAASKHDYETFYTQELEYRRVLRYPPYKRLVHFQFTYPKELQAQREAELAAQLLQQRIAAHQMTATELIGPAPSFFARIDDQYRWHIVVKTTDPQTLLYGLSPRPGWHIDIDPVDIL
jgi:primosomal protein N' (replication factor Y)